MQRRKLMCEGLLGRVGSIRKVFAAAFLLLIAMFHADAAFAQQCSMTSTNLPSLQVVRGSTNNIVYDGRVQAQIDAIQAAGCSGTDQQVASLNLERQNPTNYATYSLASPVTVTLASGGTMTITNFAGASPSGGAARVITYTPPASGAATQTISAATGSSSVTPTPGIHRFYNNGQGSGVFIGFTVTIISPNAPTAALTSLTPSTIYSGGSSTVVVTLTNPNSSAALSGVQNAITLPTGVTVAATPGASTTCASGSITASAGAGTVTLSGGTLAASASCTMTFNVTSTTVATHSINSGTPSATGANAGSAGTNANLVVQAAPSAPTIVAAYSPGNISTSGSSTLTLTITNPNGSAQLTGVGVNAGTLPGTFTGASPSTSCTSGTAAYNGSKQLSLSGATLNAGASCTVTLTVSNATPGSATYTTGTVFATGPVSVTGTTATSNALSAYAPPTISAVFDASPISTSGSTILRITIANPAGNPGVISGHSMASSALNGLTATAGSSSCGATPTITGTTSISLAGGTPITPGTSCTTLLNVSSASANTYNFTPGAPSATTPALTGVAGSQASLTVAAPPVLGLTLASGGTPVQGGTFTLTPTITNSGGGATSGNLTLTSTLPTGLSIASIAAGAQWNCSASTASAVNCIYSGTIAASGSLSSVTVTVNAAANAPTSVTPSFTVTGGGSADASGSTTVTIAQVPASLTINAGNNQSTTVSTAFSTAMSVIVRDAGNVVIPNAPVTFTVQPVSGAGGTFSNATGTITVNADVNGLASAGAFTANATSGSYTVTAAPGTGTGSATFNLTNNSAAPTVTSLSPTSGPAAGNTSVVITGTGFTGVATTGAVKFGSADATYTFDSDTQLTASSPAGSAGTVNVTVTNNSLTSNTAGSGDDYTYVGAPQLTMGVTASGTPVQGGGFALDLMVGNSGAGDTTGSITVTSTLPTGLTVSSYNFVIASGWSCGPVGGATVSCTYAGILPAGGGAAPLRVEVAVANDAPTSVTPSFTASGGGSPDATGSTTVTIAQVVATLTPSIGDGQSATVNTAFSSTFVIEAADAGGILVPGASVTFTAPASGASGTFASSGTNTETVTADGSGFATSSVFTANGIAGPYQVAVASGSATTTLGLTNTPNAPTATSLTPTAGPIAGGTTVTVTGTDFIVGNTSVTIGGVTIPSSSVTVANATSLTFSTPAHAAGNVSVTVTTASGTSGAVPGGFTYTGVPTATSLTPTSGPVAGGTSVTVTGSGFVVGDTSVTIDGTVIPSGSVTVSSATSLSFTTPAHTAGNVDVSVTTAGGTTAPIAGGFDYTPPLSATQAVPSVTGTVGTPLTAVTPVTASGGTGTISYAISPTLPLGLNFDPATGELTGTPTASLTTPTTYTVTATDSAGTPDTASATFDLTVAAGSQTISFTSTAPASATVGGATYTPTATATSGLAVAFTIDPAASAVCSISGGVVSFTGAGTCVVNANQAGDSNYSAATQVQQSFAVGQASQTISFTSTVPASATVGGATYTPTATATSGLPVAFTIDASAAASCSISGGVVSFTGAGTCVVNANQAGNANYSAATQVQQSFTVGQASQTISFTSTAPASATVGGATYTPTATATSGLAVAFTIDPAASAFCSISGGVVSFTGAGTCVVNANQAGNANYSAATQVQQSFTVGQASQTISFTSTAPASATVGGATYTPTATATSGLTVAFTIDASASSFCSISGGVVSFTGAGTCVVNANQAGDSNYSAAPQVQQSFTVAAAAPTVTGLSPNSGPAAGANTVVITGTNFTAGATVDFGGTAATGVTFDSATQLTVTAPSGTGTANVTVTTAGGTSAASQYTYIAAPTIGTVTPNEGPTTGGTSVTITGTNLTGATVTFGGAPGTSVAVNGGGTSLTANTPSGSAGAADVVVTTTGGSATATGGFTYVAAPALTSFTAGPVTYGATGVNIDVRTDSGATNNPSAWEVAPGPAQPFAASSATAQGGTVSIDSAGQASYSAPGGFRGNDSFFVRASNAAGVSNTVTVTVTIDNPVLTISLTGTGVQDTALSGVQIITSGGTAPYTCNPVLTSGALPGGTQLTSGCAITGTPNAAGTFNFTVDVTDSSTGLGAFTATSGTLSLTIDPPTLVMSPAAGALPGATPGASYSQSFSVSGGSPGYTYGLTAGAFPAGLTLTGDTLSGVPTSVGTFNFTITATDNSTGGGPYTVANSYSITVAAPSIALSPTTLTAPTIGTAYSNAVTANGGSGSYSYGVTSGALPLGLSLAGDGTLSGTATEGGTFNFIITATDTVLTGTGAPFMGSQAYAFTVGAPTITVTPASLPGGSVNAAYSQMVTASGGTAGYTFANTPGALPPGLTLLGNGTLSGTPTTAGTYNFDITATDSSTGSGPFTGTRSYALTIGQAGQTITFNPLADASLSASPLTLSASASSTLTVAFTSATTTVCTVSGTTLTLLQTGLCTIDANQPGDANYSAAPQVSQSFTVTPATLVIATNAPSGTTVGASYSQTNPASGGVAPYTYAIASGARPLGTTLDTSTGTLSGTPTTAGGFSYSIQVTDSQGAPVTVTGTTVSGTIAKGNQTISFTSTAPSAATAGGASYTVTATASSSLPVIFMLDGTSTGCALSGSTVTFTGAGTCVINANQSGDSNWNPAAQVQQSFSVTAAVPTVTGLSPNSGPVAGANTVIVTGSDFTAGATVDFGGTAATGVTFDSATQLTVTAPSGTGTANVTVTTAGGTSAPAGGNLYTWIPPAPVVTAPANGATLATATPTYSGTATAGATVNVSVDGGAANSVTANGGGNWTYTQASALADGGHTVQATSTLGGITGSASTVVNFTTDATAPAAPAITAPTDGSTITHNTPTITGTAEAGATVSVTIDGSVAGTTTATGGTWSFTAATLADGSHTTSATAADSVGNLSPTSTAVSFTVDTAAPAAPAITTPANGSTTTDNTPTITGTAEAGALVSVTIDGSVAGTTTATGGTWSFTAATLADGSHTTSATAADSVGNLSPTSVTVSFTVDTAAPAAPAITTPANGSTTTDNTPTITGTAEAGALVSVTIDGSVAGTTTATGGTWSFTSATLADGSHTVSATSADGVGNVSPASTTVSFTVDTAAPAAPAITAPANGSTTTDNTPTITGTAEAGATVSVTIDGSVVGTATATGGAWSFTSATLADGPHTVSATAADGLGNTSPASTTTSFTVDTAAPAAPVITAPANGSTTTDNTPTISGTAEAGSLVSIRVDGSVVGTTTATGGAWDFTAATLADGPHTVSATAADGVGNISPASTTVSFMVDTAAPSAPVITAPANGSTTTDNTPTISGTAEAGSLVSIRVDGSVVGTTTATGGTWSFTSATLADGSHAVSATAADSVGNVSPASTTVSFTVDTAAPAAPVVTAPADGLRTTDNTPAITGTAEAGTTVTVVIDGATAGTVTATGGSWSFTSATLGEGAHTVSAFATDSVGNASPSSATNNFTVDTAAPTAPIILQPTEGQVTSDNTPTIVGGAAEMNGLVTIIIDGTPVGTTNVLANFSFTTGTLADGPHTVAATVTDAAGNVSPVSATRNFTVDATAPAAPVVTSPANGSIINDATPTVTGTAEADATVTVVIDGATAGTTTASGGNWSFTSAMLGQGSHTVRAIATDAGGNVSASSGTNNFTIDSAGPSAPVIAAPADGSVTNDNTPAITGTAEVDSTVTVTIDGAVAGTTTATGGNWSFTAATLGDGSHTLSAVTTDSAGNVSPASVTTSFSVDTGTPAAPTVATPANGSTSNNNRPSMSGSAEGGSTVTIIIDGNPVGTTTAAAGFWSFLSPVLADGSRTVRVTATDLAGNVSPSSATNTFTIDATAPSMPVVTTPADGSTVNTPTPTVSGTAEPDVTVSVNIDGSVAGTTAASPAGTWTFAVTTPLAQGSHSVSAGAIDAANNVSPASATNTFTVDSLAPAAPSITAPANGSTTTDNTPTVTGSAEAGSTVSVTIDGSVVGTTVAIGGTWSFTSATLADGSHTVSAAATDAAGNVSPASGTNSFTVDTAAPVAPAITAPANGSTITDNTPTISGTAEAGSTVNVTIDGSVVGTTTATGGNWSFTSATLGEGSHNTSATATDGVGNVSPVSNTVAFTVDTTAPAAPALTAPASGSTITDNTPTVTGTAEAGATVTVVIDGATAGTTTATGGTWSFTSVTLGEGSHTVRAIATDASGNVSPSSGTNTFTVDSAAPAAPTVTAPANGSTTTDNTPAITGTAEAGATITVTIDGAVAGTTTATGGSWSFTAATLTDGPHTTSATAADGAGNVSPASTTVNFTVDTAAPAAPAVTAPANGSTTTDNTPTITGTAEAGSTVTVVIDGATAGTTTATGGNWSFTSATLGEGSHTVRAIATDASGNVSPSSGTNSFTVDTAAPVAPAITSPANGSITTDNTPAITGTAEADATVTVVIDGATAGTTTATGGNWTFTPATLAEGSHTVRALVTDGAGNISPSSGTNTFTVDTAAPGAPAITAPANGSTTIDSTPAISGTAEAGSTVSVTIDGAVAGTTTATGGSWSFTAATLADGAHTTSAIATDGAGNVSPVSNTITFTVDTTAPTAPVVTAPADGSTTTDNMPAITGTAEAGATVTIVIDGATAGTTIATGGNWTFTPATLAEGSHTVRAIAADASGNVSPDSATRTFTVDSAAPAAPVIISPANGSTVTTATPLISGSAEPNASVAVQVDGAPVGTVTTSPGGTWSFQTVTPLAAGPHTASAVATDAAGNASAAGTVTFNMASAPVAADRSGVAVGYEAATAIDLSGSITGLHTSIAIGTAPLHGTTSIAGDIVTYTPAAGYFGADSFTYTATGPGGTSNVATVTLNVATPAAPVAADRAGVAVGYETATAIDLSTSIAGVHSSIAIGTAPTHGTTTIAGDVVTYTPAAGYFGSDSFTYTATGPGGTSNVATVTLNVATPAAPVAADRAGVAVGYETAAAIDLSTSITGVRTSIAIGAAPAHGTASIAGDVVTYTPAAGYFGTDSFTYTATGPGGTSNVATVSINVATPAAPVAADRAGVAVGYQTATAIDLSTSITGVHSSIAIGAAPAHGTTSIAGDVVTYTPTAGYFGADSFTYTATGPGGTSNIATVSLNVATPAAPVAADRTGVAVGYETAAAINLSTSITGVHTSIAIGTAPAHGTTSIAGDVVTYTPATGYFGADSFTYTATGPGGTSNIATVSLTVATPAAPVAANRNGVAVAYNSTGTAIDLSTSITGVHTGIAIGTAPAHGTTSIAGDVVTYTPATGYFGADSFTYTATGPGGTSNVATVSLNVATPAAPEAADRSGIAVGYNSTGTAIDLSGSITGVHTSIAIGTAPAHGTTSIAGDVVTYTPATGYFGADNFTYTATGPGGTSNMAIVSLTVATPAAPVAANRNGVAVAYNSTGTAIDLSTSITGVHTSIAVGSAPAHGTISIAGDVVTYTPTAGYFGADSFSYTATGPGGTSNVATVNLTVATPAAPIAANRNGVAIPYNSAGTAIDLSTSITGVHTSIAVGTAPAHGTTSVVGDVVTYTPTTGYFGTDSFTYTATGPGGTSNVATVSINVATPPPPVSQPGTGTVAGSVSANTSVDIDLSALVTGEYDTISIDMQPSHGTVTLRTTGGGAAAAGERSALAVGRTIATYRPNAGYVGTDSFTFYATGPGGRSASSAVTINVVGSVPVAQAKTATTGDGQMVSVELTAGATEGPFTGATIVSITPAASATARIVDSGTGAGRTFRLEVTPNARYAGSVAVAYTLTNAYGVSAPATVTVTVSARPNPTADPDVRGISDAQAETTRRFARSQVANFMRRTEQLHNGGGSSNPVGVTLTSRDSQGFVRDRPAFDASALEITERMRPSAEDPMLGRVANLRDGRANRADMLGTMGSVTGYSDPAAGKSRRNGAVAGAVERPKLSEDEEGAGSGERKNGSVAIWSGGAIDISTRDATTDRTKITATTSGLSAGADIKLSDDVLIGIGGGYGNDISRIGDSAARVRSKSSLFAAYASISPGTAFIDGMVGIGDLSFSTRRTVATLNVNALGSRDGRFTVGAIAAGLDKQGDSLRWSVYGRGEFMKARLASYVETGAGRYNLRFDERDLDSLTGTLGGRIEFTGKTGFGTVTPRLRAEWNHEFADTDPQLLDYADISGVSLYSLETQGWTRDQFQIATGIRFAFPKSWILDVEAGLRAGSGEKAGTLRFQISKEF